MRRPIEPGLIESLEAAVRAVARGDYDAALRWCSKAIAKAPPGPVYDAVHYAYETIIAEKWGERPVVTAVEALNRAITVARREGFLRIREREERVERERRRIEREISEREEEIRRVEREMTEAVKGGPGEAARVAELRSERERLESEVEMLKSELSFLIPREELSPKLGRRIPVWAAVAIVGLLLLIRR